VMKPGLELELELGLELGLGQEFLLRLLTS
jgi:hypothetical protein